MRKYNALGGALALLNAFYVATGPEEYRFPAFIGMGLLFLVTLVMTAKNENVFDHPNIQSGSLAIQSVGNAVFATATGYLFTFVAVVAVVFIHTSNQCRC